MLYFTIIVLILFLILYLSSFKYQKDYFHELDKKKHPLRNIYSCAAFIQHKLLRKEDNLVKEERLYLYQKASIALICLIFFIFLVFLYELQQLSIQPEIQNNTIIRPNIFEGRKNVDAIYYLDSEKNEIRIPVSEIILLGEEREKLLNSAVLELDRLILGNNDSFDFVTHDLQFPVSLVSSRVRVKYTVKTLDLIQYDGSIKFENVSDEGNKAFVDVSFLYDTTLVSKTYEFCLFPQEVTSKMQLEEELKDELAQANEASKYKEFLVLPNKVLEHNIIWTNPKQKASIFLLFVGIILTVAVPVLLDRNKKEKEEKYRLLLQRDYPEIVSKMQLLLNAGMTTRGAWERIVLDYIRTKEQKKNARSKTIKWCIKSKKVYERPAYEQMLITKREQENGISEGVSYERFGKRCRAISYIRFSSLIAQNLKMGSKGLALILETEARSAFEERKEQAKQFGEKASTKLLGPTMGMLVVILCIIMVPAFMSF